jgi:hypothetical protein
MAVSTPGRASATPSSTQLAAPTKGRQRKPSARVIEARQSLRTRATATASRSAPNELSSVLAGDVFDPFDSVDPLDPDDPIDRTIVQQNSIIRDQNSIIESIRADLAEIKQEQRILKTQNVELQEEIRSLRTQLETLPTLPLSTETWASVAASEYPAESNTALSRTTNVRTGNKDKDCNRQLVIDVSCVREAIIERVASTEVAKQAIQQGIDGIERLAGTEIKDFRVWRMNNSTSVIKFSVEKDKEAIFWQTTAE